MKKKPRPVRRSPYFYDCNLKLKCVHCGKKFTAHRPDAKFHSAACKRAFEAQHQPSLFNDAVTKAKKRTARGPAEGEIVAPAQSCEVGGEGGDA